MERNYEEVAARFWNQPYKADEEAARELYFMDDIIQKAHLDREIDRHLGGVQTVFDGGAGTGRFTIPLARRGLKVTHFDISRPMLAKAKELAAEAGVLGNMTFVEGALTDLDRYEDGAFDLVLSFDAPISYTYPRHNEVLRHLVRIARKAVIVSVSSRLGYAPYFFNPAQKMQYLADERSHDPAVQWYVRHSEQAIANWEPDFKQLDALLESGLTEDPEQVYAEMSRGKTPWPVNYCFHPGELANVLTEAGLKNIRLAGPGAFARSIPQPILRQMLFSSKERERFLDACYRFDSSPYVCGLGKDNLVASGVK